MEKKLIIKRVIGAVSLLVFLALMTLAGVYVVMPLIRQYFGGTSAGEMDLSFFRSMMEQSPVKGRVIYVVLQVLQVFIALIPGEVVEIAGGLLFGAVEGTLLSLLGVAIGSSVIFLLTKQLGIRFVELFVSREKIDSMKFINSDKRLNMLVFIVFFIPGTPKDLLTYFVGLTRMKLHTFLLISLIARVPSVLTSALAGNALASGDYRLAVIIFGVTAVLSVIGMLIYNAISKRRSRTAE